MGSAKHYLVLLSAASSSISLERSAWSLVAGTIAFSDTSRLPQWVLSSTGGGSVRYQRRLAGAMLALLLLMAAGCGQAAQRSGVAHDNGPATTPTRPRPATTAPPRTSSTTTTAPRLVGLPTPAALTPISTPALAGEGQWTAAARAVDGQAALYVTTLRPEGSNTVAGVAWMDTRLLRATLYSGSISPGQGPWTYTAPVQPDAALNLVCAFNGGFKLADAKGGYYAESRTFAPLVAGAASLVITADGTATVGEWGRDVSMAPDVVSVRQNLTLLVDGGQPVASLSPSDTSDWGSTLGGVSQVWRSGLGVTAAGALVYVSGPALNIVQLADLLVRGGAVKAMELDMNPAWDTFTFYTPSLGEAASPANGTDLLSSMSGGTTRFFEPSWARDFVTMSAR